ncbi:hypothetical protein BDZ89DRAFT_225944 [Hymenopellis radicata]|nr:hypothetical protein BDZ89DRAFT_225944 [Hymenopellis radicata]
MHSGLYCFVSPATHSTSTHRSCYTRCPSTLIATTELSSIFSRKMARSVLDCDGCRQFPNKAIFNYGQL